MGFLDWYWGERIGTPNQTGATGAGQVIKPYQEQAASAWDSVTGVFSGAADAVSSTFGTFKLLGVAAVLLGVGVMLAQVRGLLR